MLNGDDTKKLLDTLCVKLGFCLPPDQIERLVAKPPPDVAGFTDHVFRAEGLDPDSGRRRLYRQVRDVVREAFEAALDREHAKRHIDN